MYKIDIENLHADLQQLEFKNSDTYVQTYPEFVSYFRALTKIERHHLIISSHFVYGWMPTIINLNLEETEKVLRLLNLVKDGYILSADEISAIKNAINNSLVGTSKLLHFINPEQYAIWDSRIFRKITGKKSQYGIGNPQNYFDYLQSLEQVKSESKFDAFYKEILSKIDYPISALRAIELVLFEADKQL